MAKPRRKREDRKTDRRNDSFTALRPRWCSICEHAWTTTLICCPKCMRPFSIRTVEKTAPTGWHFVSADNEAAGSLEEVCAVAHAETDRRRTDSACSIWYGNDIVATVRRLPSGKREIRLNEEHPKWKILEPMLTQAISESGLATA